MYYAGNTSTSVLSLEYSVTPPWDSATKASTSYIQCTNIGVKIMVGVKLAEAREGNIKGKHTVAGGWIPDLMAFAMGADAGFHLATRQSR
jgi:hypothetical protein